MSGRRGATHERGLGSLKGLEISRAYFADIARPRLRSAFPDNCGRLAAGLVGNGSECFGYDDELSRDHDWGVDFFLWVPDQDADLVPRLSEWKRRLFDDQPPELVRTRSDHGAQIGVMTIGEFYSSLIGCAGRPSDLASWRRIPEENLAMATNGMVFMDDHGAFTEIREALLLHFPEDLRRKKLAARCMAIAQTGQYNYRRCFLRKDRVTAHAVIARFVDDVTAAVFLLNRVYRPYYKWSHRRLTELPILGGSIAGLLEELVVGSGSEDEVFAYNSEVIAKVCVNLVQELQRQELARSDDWFMATQGEEIQSSIRDDFLRALPVQYE